ncbi:MAG: T9SS type A sorting domain-containing protein, partial [Ignavibacteria bacterium]|nr:T9SS type A sorting domain-containing protein [Ignavibacteria bacterium]
DSVAQGINAFSDQDLQPSTTYYYRLFSYYQNLVSNYSNEDSATTSAITSVENEIIVNEYKLFQNYPNPFNPSTTIRYQIPQAGMVTLKIYDILGSEVATLVNEEKVAGKYEVNFSTTGGASSLSSGVYIYKIQTRDFIASKKLLLLK